MIDKQFNFPDTFSVAVGFNFEDSFDSVLGRDIVISRLVHFSVNVYDGDVVLSDDNAPNEMCGYTNKFGNDFKDFWNFDFKSAIISEESVLDEGLEYFYQALKRKGFVINKLYNVFKNCTDPGENIFYVKDSIKDLDICKELFLYVRQTFLEAVALHWKKEIERRPDKLTKCPVEILKIVKPKLKNAIDMGVLDESLHVKTFQQFNDSRVWELKRKAVKPHNMPNIGRQNDYLQTVKEEIAQILKKIYNFSQPNIDIIQNAIWLDLKNEWQDILDDSLVNWDTPSICAQKCLTCMKEFIPLMKEA